MHGLQVFDEKGKKVFDTNTRTVKIIAKINCKDNSTVTVEHELFESETPFYIVCPPDKHRTEKRINIVGNKCFVDTSYASNKIIIVGVY